MKININNYQEYFIDYFDGNLDFLQNKQLFNFLDKHPDIKTEFEQFEEIKIKPETIKFPFKESLKKNIASQSSINESNFEDFCIAKLENQLTEKQSKEFEDYISENPENQKTFNLYLETKIKPELNILFNKKSSLKKFNLQAKKLIPYFSIAASIIIVIGLYFYSNKFVVEENPNFADKNDTSKIQIEIVSDKNQNAEIEGNIESTEEKQKSIIQKPKILNKTENIADKNCPKTERINKIDSKEEIINGDLKNKFSENLAEARIDSFKYIVPAKTNFSKDTLIKRDLKPQTVDGTNNMNQKYENITQKEPIAAASKMPQIQDDDYVSVKQFFVNILKKKIFKVNENERVDFWHVADAGLNGINKITKSKMKLKEKSNENSSIVEFSSEKFAFAIPLKKDR